MGVHYNEFINQLLQSLLDQYSQVWGSELLSSRIWNMLSYEPEPKNLDQVLIG